MIDTQAPDAGEGGIDRRTALQMMAALGGLAGSFAATGASGGEASPTGRDALWSEIDAVLRETEEIWNSQNFSRLKDVWDADDPEPWYVPEELETAFRSWPEIEKYWGPGRRVLKAFRWSFSNLQVKALASDLALALFDHFYEIEVAVGPPAPPIAGFDRCLTIFRRKPDGWKHILYAQCPLGPDTYVRVLRQKIVKPDFKAFSDQADARYKADHAADAAVTRP
ncbi:MAG: hypothetical protein OEV14_04540 [Gammaproteobacteria bacterium]|nr:hypothetical protein [Gammaproteobacteria bacterium]